MEGSQETLAEARNWLYQRLGDGVDCPCCGQRAMAHRRGLHKSMLKSLAILAAWDRENPGSPVKFEQRLRETGEPTSLRGDVAKLLYWGLAERTGSGEFRITDTGKRFLNGDLAVPRYAVVYNGKVLRHEGDPMRHPAQ